MDTLILRVHLFLTLYLAGVIWMVQLVHYPLMAKVGEGAFRAYEEAHTRRMTPVVMGQMLLELATGLYLLWQGAGEWMLWLNLGLLLLIWLSTFLVQVPLHNRLMAGWDQWAHQRLVKTNWIRTVAWTVRGILLLMLL